MEENKTHNDILFRTLETIVWASQILRNIWF